MNLITKVIDNMNPVGYFNANGLPTSRRGEELFADPVFCIANLIIHYSIINYPLFYTVNKLQPLMSELSKRPIISKLSSGYNLPASSVAIKLQL